MTNASICILPDDFAGTVVRLWWPVPSAPRSVFWSMATWAEVYGLPAWAWEEV